MITIRKATSDDTDNVLSLYSKLIDQVRNNENNPGWEHGIYPKDDRIIKAINMGSLYVGVKNHQIVSSIIVDNICNQGYDGLEWNVDCCDDEIYYVHLVAVNQDFKGQGIARQMLKHSFDLARKNSIKSIRLSINEKNIGIKPLYLKMGFVYVDSIRVDDKDRGTIYFKVFEKVL